MPSSSKLVISMFGGCSLSCGSRMINDQTVRSKKIWLLLEYLVAFRHREISQNELIDLLYPDGKSDNPGSALKTLMHRLRAVLDTLGMNSGKDIILQRRSTYAFNTALPHEVDVDVFEDFCARGDDFSLGEEERLAAYLKALDVYAGNFLPKSSLEPWVMPLVTYYQTLYKRVTQTAVSMLDALGRAGDIVRICKKAISLDPYDEFPYLHLIRSLVSLKEYRAALDQYNRMNDLFYREFGVTPSKELTALYKEIVRTSKSVETDLSVIKENLNENETAAGAFFCEYEVFKDIYRINVRAAERTGQSVYVCLITAQTNRDLPPKALDFAMEKLNEHIRSSLRRGDIYARYSVSQYVIMLPTTYENGERVMQRILRGYKRDNARSQIGLTYSLQPMDTILASPGRR